MGIFQQQFNSMLGSLVGRHLLQSVDKIAGADKLSLDPTAKADATKEWSNEYKTLSKESAGYLSELELSEIDKDKGDTALKAFGEIRQVNKEQLEKIAGLEAERTKTQALLNRWAAKPHISKRNMKKFREDIGGTK